MAQRGAAPSFWNVLAYFLRLGATGFGGPIALANYMRKDLVERDGWFTEEEYDRGLAVATACPGPLAYQLGVYCGYVKYGLLGGVGVGFAFALAPSIIVVTVAAIYVHYSSAVWIRSLFYGVGPVVVALILKACWNLGLKTLKREIPAWTVAGLALAATLIFQRELTALFVVAGLAGILLFAPRKVGPSVPGTSPDPGAAKVTLRTNTLPVLFAAVVPGAMSATAWKLFAFFFKTGLLVFGSGLVVVSFVKAYVVDQYHWLDNRAFLDAVAVGMVSPGPVVITATFVGYLVGGFGGAVAATIGIFLPSILFTVVGTPLLIRYGKNPRVAGFVRGVTVAVVGVLAGTTYLVAKPVIGDWLTVAIGLAVLAAPRIRKGIPDQVFVAAGALIGLVAYPILRPTWMP
ncbi:MAG: chromate transporter [Vulcanimicrobiaceae bacterium]